MPATDVTDLGPDELDLVGGKAANLGRLLRLGLPVPPGFVVTTAAYRAVVEEAGLAGATPAELRERLPTVKLSAGLRDAVLAAYRRLGEGPVAVRSSGTAEDLADASFAGQHDTFLGVEGPEALLDALRRCWASLWSERAVSYRRQRTGQVGAAPTLAVVVERMVPAEWAGVLLTADPISGRRDRMLVEAVEGLGEALVSGVATGSRYHLEKGGPLPGTAAGELPAEVLGRLAELGARIEEAFGGPQDVEWAAAGGQVAILQARPQTALPEARAGEDAPAPRLGRMRRAAVLNALERLPVPPYPLDQSLFFEPAFARARSALGRLGLRLPPPGEVFVEGADGVVRVVPPRPRPTPKALLRLPLTVAGALRADQRRWLEDSHATLVPLARRIDAEELAPLSDQELLDRVRELQRVQMGLLVRRFACFPRGVLAGVWLSRALRLAAGRDAPRLHADLLAAVPCATTSMNKELAGIARMGRRDAGVRTAFIDDDADGVAERLRESDAGRLLLAGVRAFLEHHGLRQSLMPSVATPAWREDPSIVYGLLKGLVAGEDEAPGPPAVKRARRELRGGGPRRRLFGRLALRLVGPARAFVAFREDSNYELLLVFPVVRRLALELGRRLAERGALERPEDVAFLRLEELERACSSEGEPAGPRETAARRRLARARAGGAITGIADEALRGTTTAGELRGTPASAGTATGVARVVHSEADFATFQPGEVLVARATNPSWTPLFTLAAAVVVDAGGAASHAAIVAREYAIPAVMGTGNATSILRTGQRVLVDGNTGRVTRL